MPSVLELGARAGFPSVSIAATLKHQFEQKRCVTAEAKPPTPLVVATDISQAALALTVANAFRNGVGEIVTVAEANHTDISSLISMRNKFFPSIIGRDGTHDGFDIVLGSSLQGLFNGTSDPDAPLWRSLDVLLLKTNPNAIAILSHVRSGDGSIDFPSTVKSGKDGIFPLFECSHRIHGDQFEMKTRDGSQSDFEVLVFRRWQIGH